MVWIRVTVNLEKNAPTGIRIVVERKLEKYCSIVSVLPEKKMRKTDECVKILRWRCQPGVPLDSDGKPEHGRLRRCGSKSSVLFSHTQTKPQRWVLTCNAICSAEYCTHTSCCCAFDRENASPLLSFSITVR